MCECKYADSFDQEFIKLARTEVFKQYVRQAVNDELFWNQLFENNRIKSQVKTHLTKNIPKKVNEYLSTNLESMVSKNIRNLLPDYLRNNVQMQQILANHTVELNNKLSQSAKDIVNEIVNDEEYHVINKAYFDAFNNRGDTAINTMKQNGQRNIREINDRCENKMKSLTSEINNIRDMKKRMNDLENSNQNLKYFSYISIGALMGGLCYLARIR